MAIDHILEVLAQARVQWLQIDLALHDLQQTIELIDRQVLNDGLRHGSDLLLRRLPRQRLVDEVSVDFLERWVPTIDQVPQIVDRGWLVLDQDQKQVQRQCCQGLAVAVLVDRTDVRDSLYDRRKEKSKLDTCS